MQMVGDFEQLNYKKFEPIGKCIYCGSLENLTEEHIVPYGLGGTSSIPKASCKACAAITGQYEQYVLRGPLWAIRAHLKLTSRRPQEAPKKLAIDVVRGESVDTVDLALEDHPLMVVFPQFDVPTVLTGNHTKGIRTKGLYSYVFGKPMADVLRDLGADDIRLSQNYKFVPFARMIGKIGWAMAAAKGSLEKIDQDSGVRSTLIGCPDNIGRWVGTFTDGPRKYARALHRIEIKEDRDRNLMYADVQLFADSETPAYGVILGTLR